MNTEQILALLKEAREELALWKADGKGHSFKRHPFLLDRLDAAIAELETAPTAQGEAMTVPEREVALLEAVDALAYNARHHETVVIKTEDLMGVIRLAHQSAPQVDRTRELQAMAVDKRSDLQALLKIADHLDSLVEWTIGNAIQPQTPPCNRQNSRVSRSSRHRKKRG